MVGSSARGECTQGRQFGFDGKTRSDDPTTYAADVSRTVTTALTNRVRVGGRRMQNCVVGFEFNAPTEGRVE